MLLFRTHKFDDQTRIFCERLAAESGLRLVCLVDERRGHLDVGGFEKLNVSAEAVGKLGLHMPKGWQWRCGDYGLYLAAKTFPQVERFWLVEYDVRINSSGSLGDFFAAFAREDADLIAPLFTQRDHDWWWYPAMQGGEKPVFGCLFPILRASAPLVAAALKQRRRIGRSPIYRVMWPNDESFLATVAVRQGLKARDINQADATFYTDRSFSYDGPWSGEDFERSEPDGLIYHPVLFGVDYERKRNILAQPSTLRERAQRKLRTKLANYA